MTGMMAQAQQFMADSINRWISMTPTLDGGSLTSLDSWIDHSTPVA